MTVGIMEELPLCIVKLAESEFDALRSIGYTAYSNAKINRYSEAR